MAGVGNTFAYDSPASALAALLGAVQAFDTERVPLEQASGRVLGEAARLDRPSPSADVSSMDGYAVRIRDLHLGRLPVVGEVRIGSAPPPMPAVDQPGCLRIVTGGAVPSGADAVVKREDVREEADGISFDVALASRVRPGEFIRRRGENAPAGHVFADAGMPITPALAGGLAAAGIASVSVHRRVRVAMLTTGDELVSPAEPAPSDWHVRNSNAASMDAMLRAIPIVSGVNGVHVRDDEAAMRQAIARALDDADAVVLSGGVSAGHRDFVPACLRELGVRVLFHGMPQRPGKPMLAGVTKGGAPVLALPGNPVSSLVTCRRYLVPALWRRAGRGGEACVPRVVVRNADASTIPLWWHRLVTLNADGSADLLDNRGSGDLVAAARSDGFIEVPPQSSGAGPWPFYAWIG